VTSGAFAVTITNGAGSPYGPPQGFSTLLIFDSTNGARRGTNEFLPGTTTVFYQSFAPFGWTQNTSFGDHAMRIVASGGGAAHAGSRGASTVFASQLSVDGHALSTAEMPSHNHTDNGHTHPLIGITGIAGGATAFAYITVGSGQNTGIGYADISYTGSNAAHAHTFTLGASYIDFILCSKS
jgi:hypothetical protein